MASWIYFYKPLSKFFIKITYVSHAFYRIIENKTIAVLTMNKDRLLSSTGETKHWSSNTGSLSSVNMCRSYHYDKALHFPCWRFSPMFRTHASQLGTSMSHYLDTHHQLSRHLGRKSPLRLFPREVRRTRLVRLQWFQARPFHLTVLFCREALFLFRMLLLILRRSGCLAVLGYYEWICCGYSWTCTLERPHSFSWLSFLGETLPGHKMLG